MKLLAVWANACLLWMLFGGSSARSVSDWRQDIDEIVKDVEAVHPNPFAKTGKLTFLRRAEALKVDIPRLGEEERVVGLMRLIALIGDTHTQLEPNRPDFALWYPIRIYAFTDGYFVTAAHPIGRRPGWSPGARSGRAAGRGSRRRGAELDGSRQQLRKQRRPIRF
jgi:hypothetical protein